MKLAPDLLLSANSIRDLAGSNQRKMQPSLLSRQPNTALLQELLTPEELGKLRQEFPQFRFMAPAMTVDLEASAPSFEEIVIFFGCKLSPSELEKMPQLRWIHCPNPQLGDLPLAELNEASQILVTHTKGENLFQMREYVMAATLACAKQLFYWQSARDAKEDIWDLSPPFPALTLQERRFLQIGLGRAGTAISEGAKGLGMRVWGCDRHATFHPHCKKVYTFRDLNTLLPSADVVSICMPRGQIAKSRLGEAELSLIKDGAILIVLGAGGTVDEAALVNVAPRLRGVIMDAFTETPLDDSSPLWDLPNVVISPGVATHPRSVARLAYRTFRHNLRQFIHRNVLDMWNVVERPFEEALL